MPQLPSPIVVTGGSPQSSSPPVVVITPQQLSDDALPPTPSELAHSDTTLIGADTEGSASDSISLGVFEFDTPSAFITPSAIKYLETILGGQRWTSMIKAYLQLEAFPVQPGVRMFLFIFYRVANNINLVSPSSPRCISTSRSWHMDEDTIVHC